MYFFLIFFFFFLKKALINFYKKDSGYKLTFLGYDYLALYAFIKRGHVK